MKLILPYPAEREILAGCIGCYERQIELTTKNSSGPSNETKRNQHRRLQEIARGYRQAQILLTCVDLGVFEALANHHATALEIAKATGRDSRSMDLLLNAATALGLLGKHGLHFSNSPLAETCLTSKGAGDISQFAARK